MSNKIKKNKRFKPYKRKEHRAEIKEEKQFKRLKEEILKDMECNKCGICCNTYTIKLTQKDIEREPSLIENSVLMAQKEIEKYKLKYIRFLNHVSKDSKRCVFYDNNIGCMIHETKPSECSAYTPSLGHCKNTELGRYCNLTEYFNKHQKAFTEDVKKCKGEDKRKRLLILINAFIFPFITKYDVDGFVEPDYKIPIPSFIKKCLGDDKYQIIEDIPMIKNFYNYQITN